MLSHVKPHTQTTSLEPRYDVWQCTVNDRWSVIYDMIWYNMIWYSRAFLRGNGNQRCVCEVWVSAHQMTENFSARNSAKHGWISVKLTGWSTNWMHHFGRKDFSKVGQIQVQLASGFPR
jgi:hypothetical protein